MLSTPFPGFPIDPGAIWAPTYPLSTPFPGFTIRPVHPRIIYAPFNSLSGIPVSVFRPAPWTLSTFQLPFRDSEYDGGLVDTQYILLFQLPFRDSPNGTYELYLLQNNFQLPFRDSPAVMTTELQPITFQLPFRDSEGDLPPPQREIHTFNSLSGIQDHTFLGRKGGEDFQLPFRDSGRTRRPLAPRKALSTPFPGFWNLYWAIPRTPDFQLPFRDSQIQ